MVCRPNFLCEIVAESGGARPGVLSAACVQRARALRQLTRRACAQTGVSAKKLRQLHLARRAAACMRWDTMQSGHGHFDERGSGDEIVSDADVVVPGGLARAPERGDEAVVRAEKTRCVCRSSRCNC